MRARKYPIHILDLNESILLPYDESHSKTWTALQVRSSIYKYSKKTGKKFRTKSEWGGFRVLRVK